MEFIVDGAERMLTENGKMQHLSYWSYKLLTRSFLASYQNPTDISQGNTTVNYIKGNGYVDYCTWHRYSDFEWLAEHLQLEFPGILFPPIPLKEADGTVDKLTDLFHTGKEVENGSKDNPLVQKRIRQFQMTFNALAHLKEVHDSPILRNFLTLDDASWLTFREQYSKQAKTPLLKAVQSKGLNLIAKIKSVGESTEKALASSPLGAPHKLQREMEHLARTCQIQIEHMLKHITADISRWCDFDALCKPLEGAKMPWTMCSAGHFVQHADQPGKEGVVRHVDAAERVAWVEWSHTEGELNRVPLETLRSPSSGISDPAVLAMQELAGHVESYCMYLSRFPHTETLKKLECTLWFISQYAKGCTRTIERICESERELQSLTKSTSEKSKGSKQERLESLKSKVFTATSRFTRQYNDFYCPFISEAWGEVAKSFGEVSSKLMCDDQWEERLARANASLTLKFDFPPQAFDETSKEPSNSYVDPVAPIKEQFNGKGNNYHFGSDSEKNRHNEGISVHSNKFMERRNVPLGHLESVPESKNQF